MAIRNIKELINNKGYIINPEDRAIFEEKDLQSFFGFSESDAIEFIIYDINDNQLPQVDGNLVRYIPLTTENISDYFLIQDGTLFQKYQLPSEYFIDVERLLSEAGYTNGIFKTQITLLNKRAGSEKEYDKLWINEISPSRTEVRLFPLKEGVAINSELQKRFNIFVNGRDFREDTISYALQLIESIDATKLSLFLRSKYNNAWVDELISEFKIKDFESFLNNIFVKFREACIYEFTNRISKIDDVNYGKPKRSKPNIELSKKEIVDICQKILVYIINYYLPSQDVKTNTTITSTLDASNDPVSTILQSSNSDLQINPADVEIFVTELQKPETQILSVSIEKAIKEVITEPTPVYQPVDTPPYEPPVTSVVTTPVTSGGGGGGGGADVGPNDLGTGLGRERDVVGNRPRDVAQK